MRIIQHSENILTPQEAAAQFEMLVNYRLPQLPGSFTQAKVAASIPEFVEALKDNMVYTQNRAPTGYFDVLDYILEKIEANPASFVFTEIRATEGWRLANTKSRLFEYAMICGVTLRDVSNLFRFLKYPSYSIGPSCSLIADFNTDYTEITETPEPNLESLLDSKDITWLEETVNKPERNLNDCLDPKDIV